MNAFLFLTLIGILVSPITFVLNFLMKLIWMTQHGPALLLLGPNLLQKSPMEDLFLLYMSLGGVAALLTIVVNILKKAGWVKDGDASTWSLGLNLLGMVALFVVKTFFPQVDVGGVDEIAGTLAQVLALVVGLVLQLLTSKGTHAAIRGVPLIGKSYTVDFQRQF